MDLIGQPFVGDGELLPQLFDNTFADVAVGSDVIRVDGDADGFHGRSY
jgi:hypothetical protein